jgi:N-acyl homoserine lactone hydrolase
VVVLAEAGVSPADVQHVFLTHAHFDHTGNTDAFPNATFYLQERELSKWIPGYAHSSASFCGCIRT